MKRRTLGILVAVLAVILLGMGGIKYYIQTSAFMEMAVAVGVARAVDARKTYGEGDTAVHALAGIAEAEPDSTREGVRRARQQLP